MTFCRARISISNRRTTGSSPWRVTNDGELGAGERWVFDAKGVGHGANTVFLYSILRRMLRVNADNAHVDGRAP